jgi:HTH-type transcriptional regulator/antitoxin HigA
MKEKALQPARAVRPGRIIELELAARGWTQEMLATIMGYRLEVIGGIIQGHTQITTEMAAQLAVAFGTSQNLWFALAAASGK